MRFLGHTEAKIDAKGRAFLPSGFRKVLQASGQENLVMRKDVFESCLVLYPESVWNAQLDTLRRRLSRWNKREQAIFRMFVSDVELITLDGNGRFLIPKRYLKMAGISHEVNFIGVDDTIEIWASEGEEKSGEDSTSLSTEEFGRALEQLMGETTPED